MSEFDKLKDDAEQYAREHPQQVHEAEQAAEDKLGIGGQQGQAGQQDQYGQEGQQGDQQGQYGSQQDQAGY